MARSIEHRTTTRIPFESEVRVQFPDMEAFVSETAKNISLGGMFIATSEPAEVGHHFRFHLDIAGEVRFISGQAVVRWRRTQSTSGLPCGMGVEFIGLDEVSKSIIFRLIDNYIQAQGGEPFNLTARTDPS
jgi:uncharacterized protein (TIGR02266 family)